MSRTICSVVSAIGILALLVSLVACGGGSGNSSGSGLILAPAPAPSVTNTCMGAGSLAISCTAFNIVPPGGGGGGGSASCSPSLPSTVVTNGKPFTLSQATLTGYGYTDNAGSGAKSNQGSFDIFYDGQQAPKVLHGTAGGTGTYCDPASFATEPSAIASCTAPCAAATDPGGNGTPSLPPGTMIYVPSYQRYFVLEDQCTNSGNGAATSHDTCTGIHYDLWVGGTTGDDANTSSGNAVLACENKINDGSVVVNPAMPANPQSGPGPMYSDGSGCSI